MNGQIETLAKVAGYDPITKAAMKALGFDLEKFAELIVEEMHDFIVDQVGNDNGIPNLGKVKNHLGIE